MNLFNPLFSIVNIVWDMMYRGYMAVVYAIIRDLKFYDIEKNAHENKEQVLQTIRQAFSTRIDDIDEHWAFGEAPQGIQMQAVNCNCCGNFVQVSTRKLWNDIPYALKCNCPHQEQLSQMSNSRDDWETRSLPDWPTWADYDDDWGRH
jgi:hypothetical protein